MNVFRRIFELAKINYCKVINMSALYTELDKPIDELTMLCRACLVNSGEMKNIFEWGLADEFFKIADVKPYRSENVSELLCSACEDLMLTCQGFRTKCQNNDLLLRNTAAAQQTHAEQATTEEVNTVTTVLLDKKVILKINSPNTETKVHLTCPYCPMKYIKQKDLKIHLSKSHQQNLDIELQYYCSNPTCSYYIASENNKYFFSRKYLNQHYVKVHKSKVFECDLCNEKFSTSSELYRHMKNCNTTFTCPVCSTNYPKNERLLVHIKRTHPEYHKEYKERNKSIRRLERIENSKRPKLDLDYICDSPKRNFATQTLKPEDNIKNDVWVSNYTKTDNSSTQTMFDDLISLKSQTSEDDILFSETVSLSDIQTQTFPIESFRLNKETITSETQSPDLSIKETQTCFCLYDSPKLNFKLFDSVSSSPTSSAETQTPELMFGVKSDVMLSFNTAETQTSFDEKFNADL